jgi:hypothetical protein
MAKKKAINIDDLLQQGFSIIQDEIKRLQKGTPQLLSQEAAQVLNNYLRTLLAMKREERQDVLSEDLTALNDQELDKLAQQAMTFVKKKDSK